MNETTIRRFHRITSLAEIQAYRGDDNSIEETLQNIEKVIKLIRDDKEDKKYPSTGKWNKNGYYNMDTHMEINGVYHYYPEGYGMEE